MTSLKQDTAAFLDLSGRLLSAGYRVQFRAHGASMRPTIRDGQTVTVEVVEPSAVKPGDILLYRHGQRPFAHRVVQIHEDGNAVVGFVLRGDATALSDAPVKPEQILGRVLLPERDIVRRLISYFWSRRNHFLAPRAIRQT